MGITTGVGVEANVGDGAPGLAARQLLAESVLSAGACFTDEHDAGKQSKGSGKGKNKQGKGGRQAGGASTDMRMCRFAIAVYAFTGELTACLASAMQATEEEMERKELNKDMTAIANLLTAARVASMALSLLPHTSEMQTDLKDKMQVVKKHQETLDDKVFGQKRPNCNIHLHCLHIALSYSAQANISRSAEQIGEYIMKHKADFEARIPCA